MKALLLLIFVPFLMPQQLAPAVNVKQTGHKVYIAPANVKQTVYKPYILPAQDVTQKPVSYTSSQTKAAPAPDSGVARTATTAANVSAETPAAPSQPQGQCAGYPNGQCEFNPAISQWLAQTGGKDGTTSSDKCYDTSQCLNPDRPYFDGWGNQFDYQGNLISVGSCTASNPAGPNPYCEAQP